MPSYNRYNVRTGQMTRVEAPAAEPARALRPRNPGPLEHMNRPMRQSGSGGLGGLLGGLTGGLTGGKSGSGLGSLLSGLGLGGKKPSGSLLGVGGELGGFFQKLGLNFNLSELETEDYILMLILFLMYRESGDTELLIALGAMLLT